MYGLGLGLGLGYGCGLGLNYGCGARYCWQIIKHYLFQKAY